MAKQRRPRPARADAPRSITATEAKNSFAELLDASAHGPVYITRHEKTKAVLLSIEHYRELAAKDERRLDTLSEEFDALLARMQQPEVRARTRAAFGVSPKEMGKAAVAAARKR